MHFNIFIDFVCIALCSGLFKERYGNCKPDFSCKTSVFISVLHTLENPKHQHRPPISAVIIAESYNPLK